MKIKSGKGKKEAVPRTRCRSVAPSGPSHDVPVISRGHDSSLPNKQSCDWSQVDGRPLRPAPVFPSTGCRAAVCVTRLSQELLDTCRSSGFVSCSQDARIRTSPVVHAKSPTFPKSPVSPLFADWGDDGEQSPEPGGSPVFGRTTQSRRSPSACKPRVCQTSGLMFSSQESLSSGVRSASSRPRSAVFPGSPPAGGTPAVSSGTEPGRGCSSSPAGSDVTTPWFAETRGCHGDVESPSISPSPEEVSPSRLGPES